MVAVPSLPLAHRRVTTDGNASRVTKAITELGTFVWRTLRRFGLPDPDAEDAAQEVFVVFAQRIDEIAPGLEKRFLFYTALNVARSLKRAQRRRREDEEQDLAVAGDALDEQTDRRRALKLLGAAIERLSEEHQVVFVLCDLEQLTMAEAAAMLDLPAGTVASRLRRARQEVRAAALELQESMKRQEPIKVNDGP